MPELWATGDFAVFAIVNGSKRFLARIRATSSECSFLAVNVTPNEDATEDRLSDALSLPKSPPSQRAFWSPFDSGLYRPLVFVQVERRKCNRKPHPPKAIKNPIADPTYKKSRHPLERAVHFKNKSHASLAFLIFDLIS